LAEPRWWELRPAQNAKPATYTCPFCGERLHAMSEHALIAPEGDVDRRRHAHTDCVVAARRAGALPTYDDWRQAHPPSDTETTLWLRATWRLRRIGRSFRS
jgi:hypothetical protein